MYLTVYSTAQVLVVLHAHETVPCFFCLDNIIKRIFNILKFTWVLFLATVDSFTTWLNSISREHIDISTVLRIERCMLTREIKKVMLLAAFPLLLATSKQLPCPRKLGASQPKMHGARGVSNFQFWFQIQNIFT